MIPQLDGTFNISEDSESDLHGYLDLASRNIIAYRTQGQKHRHDENERANTKYCTLHIVLFCVLSLFTFIFFPIIKA